MFSLSLLRNIKSKYGKVIDFLNNTNISAAVSEMEDFGALVAQYSQKRADEVYNVIDNTWDVVCHVENRVPSEYRKFGDKVATLFASVIADYLYENDSKFKALMDQSTSVIRYAKNCSSYAFTLALSLSETMKSYSYKHGSDYKYYFSGYDENSNGCKRLITLTQDYCGQVIKIAVKAFNQKI